MPKNEETDAGRPPAMSFSDLMALTLKFNDRLDTLWQRVIYTHAALVGVMVFFARSQELFVVQRLLVFFLYTVSSLITYVSIRDTLRGYHSALQDLAELEREDAASNVQDWIRMKDVGNQTQRYGMVLACAWAVLGYILLGPLIA